MIESWRWFGPKDPVTLPHIRQAGATGVVSALHTIANGEVWSKEDILKHKYLIEKENLKWLVVESVPVHEEIKLREGNFARYIENYCQTLKNLGQCGIHTVCYNFMPVLDWTRTDLGYELPGGAKALRFDQIDFAVFELYLLKRAGAEKSYTDREKAQAEVRFAGMDEQQKQKLIANIIAGLPGAEEHYTTEQLQRQLERYQDIDAQRLQHHLAEFLREILPAAEAAGVRLAIHPDDPPRPILGLPRVVSTLADMDAIRAVSNSEANGFTFCTGSYGVRTDNDLAAMLSQHADRVYFAHLRATKREEGNPLSFHEAEHLNGDVDMYVMVKQLLEEEWRRGGKGDIPVRPDHGHQMLDDLQKQGINPGYTAIGRLKGLAEIRGLMLGITRARAEKS